MGVGVERFVNDVRAVEGEAREEIDPLRAVAPAIEMLADVTSRRPRLQAEGLASPALLALCSLALAPLRSATVAALVRLAHPEASAPWRSKLLDNLGPPTSPH